MKRALLYIRVSTSKQDRDGYSIPLQKERLLSYCKAMGWVVAGVYVDPGFSGASLDRPGMNALIKAIEEKKGDTVLVYKLDRLSRSQRNILYILEEVFEPQGVSFVSMQESFDTSTVYGKAMLGILSVFAQMEREVITERTMMGRSGRAEKGLFHGGGTDPIGYDYIDGELRVNREEARQVRQVYELYSSGYSVTEISRRMEGFQTKHGGWGHTSTVGNVLDNPLYAGIVHFDGVVGPGKHEAIIPAALNKRVKDRREAMRRVDASGDSPYLLTGMIFCDCCGARYFPNKRPNGSIVYSCYSRAKKNRNMIKDPNCKAPHIPISELDAMVEAELLQLAAHPERLNDIKKRAIKKDSSSADEVQRLEAEISRLMDLYQHSNLANVEEIAARIQAAHDKKVELSPGTETRQGDFQGFRLLLDDVRHSWSFAGIKGRRVLLAQLLNKIRINQSGAVIDWLL